MQDAKPSNNHMSRETAEKIADFCRESGDFLITISGGEPLEHPQALELIHYFAYHFQLVTVCTNGIELLDKEFFAKYEKLPFNVATQISTHRDFYTSYSRLKEFKSLEKKLAFCTVYDMDFARTDTYRISSQGRAINMQSQRKSPSCGNMILVANQVSSWCSLITEIRRKRYFCTPSVGFNGSVYLGESWLCESIGSINEDTDTLYRRTQNFRGCNGCADSKELLFRGLRQLGKVL